MIARSQFISSAQQEIESFYGPYTQEKKGLALEMMDHGLAWSSVRPVTGVWFGKYERKSRRQYKKECREYILENYKVEPQVSGFIGSSVIFWLLFRWVLSWVVNHIIDNYVLAEEN